MKDNKLVIVIHYDNGVYEEGIQYLKNQILAWGIDGGWFDGIDLWCNQALEKK